MLARLRCRFGSLSRRKKKRSEESRSHLAAVQSELFASQAARREAEEAASALWELYFGAADREEALLQKTKDLEQGHESLAELVPAMRAAEEQALEMTRAHEAAHEHADVLRAQEEHDAADGRAVIEATNRAMEAQQLATKGTAQPQSAESLKALVEQWRAADDEAQAVWARFSASRQAANDRFADHTADAFALSPLAALLSAESLHAETSGTSLLQVANMAVEGHTVFDREMQTSRTGVVQAELQTSARQCRAAESIAAALLTERIAAKGRSAQAKRRVHASQSTRNALREAVSAWRAAQQETVDSWDEYSAQEELAGVLREQEQEDLGSGLLVLAAEKECMAAKGSVPSATAKTLKHAVQAWRLAEQRSDDSWTAFSEQRAMARAQLPLNPRHSSRASHTVAAANGDAKELGAGDEFAMHLRAAMELADVVRDAAAHVAQETGQNASSQVSAALQAVANVSAVLAEAAVAKESVTQAVAAQHANADHLGQFVGVPESFTDIAGSFPGLLGGPNGFSVAFTAKWDALHRWSRVLDFGNAVAIGSKAHGSNIVVANEKSTDTFVFAIYGAQSNAFLTVPKLIKVGESNRFLCSVDEEGHMRIYKDGNLVGEKKNGVVPPAVPREHLYIGKSNFAGNEMFEGEIEDMCVWNGAASWEDTKECAAQQRNE